MKFVNWDWRPAVLVGGRAFALLAPGGSWEEVDAIDVRLTGYAVPDEATFRATFKSFGYIDLSKIPVGAASPRDGA